MLTFNLLFSDERRAVVNVETPTLDIGCLVGCRRVEYIAYHAPRHSYTLMAHCIVCMNRNGNGTRVDDAGAFGHHRLVALLCLRLSILRPSVRAWNNSCCTNFFGEIV